MSVYTAIEIAAWIVAAAVVGSFVGWLLSLARRDDRLAQELEASDARARDAATTVATREREVIQLTEQAQRVAMEGRETAGALRVQLAAAQDHRDQARASLADARAEIERLRAEGRALSDQLERAQKQLQDARAAVDHLTGECTNAQRLLAAVEVERDQAIDDRDVNRAKVTHLATLQGERDRALGQAEALTLRLDDAVERRTKAEDALIAARAEADRLRRVLESGTGIEADEGLLAVRTAERDGLADTVTRLDALYADVVQAHADAQGVIAGLKQTLEAERIDHAASRATLTAVLQERNHLRALIGQAGNAPPLVAPFADAVDRITDVFDAELSDSVEDDRWDDLSRLRGIGAKTASKLAGLGIVRFDQVADLDGAAMDELARTLGMAPERIRQQDWPGQARALLADRGQPGGDQSGGSAST